MSIPNPLAHINRYGERHLDTVTLRHLLDHAKASISYNANLKVEIEKVSGAKDYVDKGFQRDDDQNQEAIERIEAELKKRDT